MTNEELIKEYPFLEVKDPYGPGNWSNCWLDDLEPGWRKAFGEDLCRDLKAAIKKDGCENTFEILQIKEKYAELRFYAVGYGDNVRNVISKYEELSRYICGHCGKPATKITRGWYYPLCNDCIEDIFGAYSPIENFYGFNSYEDVQKEVEKIKTDFKHEDYWKPIDLWKECPTEEE